jgi:ribosomal protein S27AE
MTMFYLQDSRSYLGNSMLWWGQQGYTTDLNNARVFTHDEAMEQHRQRETDIPWPVDYIAQHMQLTVDMQYVRRSHLQNYGIVLQKPKPVKRETLRCYKCGGFMGYAKNHHYQCPKCGENNAP